ncbi:37S ribosomal protein S23 mitochondrial [Rhizophlyctis rosea]|nr:37S ribosomal protein S23 mitochondrial [Rhizophlyctis rosea]
MQKNNKADEGMITEKAVERPLPDIIPVYRPNKSAPAVPLGEWVPEMATPDNVPQVLALPETFVKAVPLDSLTSHLMRNFSEFHQPALMARKITLRVLDEIVTESKKDVADRVLVLGMFGITRSHALRGSNAADVAFYRMTQTEEGDAGKAQHSSKQRAILHNKGGLSFMFREPYDEAKGSNGRYLDQPQAAAKLLKAIEALNGELLKKIQASSGKGTLSDIVKRGIADSTIAHESVEALFAELSSTGAQDKPPVLLAIDQVNGLYSRTQYKDVDNGDIYADRFTTSRHFINFLNGERKLHGAILTATDNSTSQIKSPLISHIVKHSPSIALPPSDSRLPITESRVRDLSGVDEFGVLLNKELAPESWDEVSGREEVHPKGVVRVEVGDFGREEVDVLLRYYDGAGLLSEARKRPGVVEKFLMMTGGNGVRIFKDVLTAL